MAKDAAVEAKMRENRLRLVTQRRGLVLKQEEAARPASSRLWTLGDVFENR